MLKRFHYVHTVGMWLCTKCGTYTNDVYLHLCYKNILTDYTTKQ